MPSISYLHIWWSWRSGQVQLPLTKWYTLQPELFHLWLVVQFWRLHCWGSRLSNRWYWCWTWSSCFWRSWWLWSTCTLCSSFCRCRRLFSWGWCTSIRFIWNLSTIHIRIRNAESTNHLEKCKTMQILKIQIPDLKLVPKSHIATVHPSFSTRVYFFGIPGWTIQPSVLKPSSLNHQNGIS